MYNADYTFNLCSLLTSFPPQIIHVAQNSFFANNIPEIHHHMNGQKRTIIM